MNGPEHSTYMGDRRIGTFGGGPLYFARCHCGWEGPSRIDRSVAVREAEEHLETVAAEPAPEVTS